MIEYSKPIELMACRLHMERGLCWYDIEIDQSGLLT